MRLFFLKRKRIKGVSTKPPSLSPPLSKVMEKHSNVKGRDSFDALRIDANVTREDTRSGAGVWRRSGTFYAFLCSFTFAINILEIDSKPVTRKRNPIILGKKLR